MHWVEVERAIPQADGEIKKSYKGPYLWAVKQAPVLVGPYLDQHLYQGKQSLILTSATLRTTLGAGFGFLLERVGLKGRVQQEDAINLPPELDYGRALFGIARYMRSDARPTEIDNFVDEVGQEFELVLPVYGWQRVELIHRSRTYGIGIPDPRTCVGPAQHPCLVSNINGQSYDAAGRDEESTRFRHYGT